jgi:dihydrofolate reductase
MPSVITDGMRRKICAGMSIWRPPVRSTGRRRPATAAAHRSRKEIVMRKIVASLFVSLDGVVESPEAWTGPYFTPEIGQHIGSSFAESDTLLVGRMTYQTFAGSFAGDTSGDPMAAQMNAIPKVVVSTTLDRAEWQNSTLISGDVATEITRLKQRPGKNITISGSATLVGSLLREGLLDGLDLLLFPVVVGHGKRLFGDGSQVGLKLAGSEAFSSGVMHLTYHPAGG